MPAEYKKIYDTCLARKRKNKDEITETDRDACQKMAAIIYYKRHSKPVKHGNSTAFVLDANELKDNTIYSMVRIPNTKIVYEVDDKLNDFMEIIKAPEGYRAVELSVASADIVMSEEPELIGISKAEAAKLYEAIDGTAQGSVLEETELDDFLPASDQEKQKDLMYIAFKLVHVGTNRNKDAFMKEDLTASQFTPMLKPIDWEHGEPNIGAIYLSKYVESDNDEPDYIKCAAAIYKYKYPDYAQEVVDRYEQGTLKFSMEVYFASFECNICNSIYKATESDICEHLANRNEMGSSAARILHGLVFAGAGVVEDPADVDADPLSIASVPVSSAGNYSDSSDAQPNSTEKEEKNMAKDQVTIEKSFTEDEIQAMIDKAVNPINDKLSEAHTTIESLTSERDDAVAAREDFASKLTEALAELESLKEDLQTTKDEYESYKESVAAENRLSQRLAELAELQVEVPTDEAEADKFVEDVKSADEATYSLLKKALMLKGTKIASDSGDSDDSSDASDDSSDGDDEDDSSSTDIPVSDASASIDTNKLDSIRESIRKSMRG